jgi:competence protein ComEA
MFKKILAFLSAMAMVSAFAAVDINKGTEADLNSIKGLGPAKSKLILDERKKGEFKSWEDFISRVKGFGEASATKLSAEGLTVGGASYKPAAKSGKDGKAADAKPQVATATAAAAKPAATAAATGAAATGGTAAAKPEAAKK